MTKCFYGHLLIILMNPVIYSANLPPRLNKDNVLRILHFIARPALIVVLFLTTLHPTLVKAGTTTHEIGTNINENGNFHNAEPGPVTTSNQVTNWNLRGMDHANYEIVADSADANNRFLKVTITDQQGADDHWTVQAIHTNIMLQAGTRYYVLLETKVIDNVSNAQSALLQLHPRGLGADGVAMYRQSIPTDQWTELETAAFEAEEDGELTVAIHLSHRDNPADLTFLIDRLEVHELKTIIEPPPDIPLASGHEKFLGSIASPAHRPNWSNYWNQLTPENSGKWRSVERERGVRNWTALDNKYRLTRDLGIPFRFHVLLWGSQQPDWITELTEEQQLVAIENWFRAVAHRYPGIEYLEVLNEQLPGHGGLPYKEALGGPGETGWDWIINAFQLARDIFPDSTRLMINDYGIIGARAQNLEIYMEIIGLLQERNLIDGIGVQGHHFTLQGSPRNPRPTTSQIRNRLDRLAETGLPIQITELDIAGNPMLVEGLTPEESDQIQLEDYQRIFPVLWEHPAVEGITLWGFRPGGWRPEHEMWIVRSDDTERPAMQWLRQYLAGQLEPTSSDELHYNIPHAFSLYQNYPNPFNPATSIRYELPENALVTLEVFDMLGRRVATLVNEAQASGQHQAAFDATGLSSGLYLYRLQAGEFSQTRKMLLVK